MRKRPFFNDELRALFGRQHHYHLPAFKARFTFDFGNRFRLGFDPVQNVHAEMLMGHLTTAKSQGNFDFVAFFEKSADGTHLDVIVVIVDARPHLDFFDLDDLLIFARFSLLLLLLVLEFAVVQDFADRRLRIGGDLDKVETRVSRSLQGVKFADDSDVLSSLVDQSHVAGPDLVVDLGPGWLARRRGSHRFADGSNSSCCCNARLAILVLLAGLWAGQTIIAENWEKRVPSQAVAGPYNLT